MPSFERLGDECVVFRLATADFAPVGAIHPLPKLFTPTEADHAVAGTLSRPVGVTVWDRAACTVGAIRDLREAERQVRAPGAPPTTPPPRAFAITAGTVRAVGARLKVALDVVRHELEPPPDDKLAHCRLEGHGQPKAADGNVYKAIRSALADEAQELEE